MYSISTIASVSGATFLQQVSGGDIDHLLVDSRKLLFPQSTIFFSLSGPRRSGNDFIGELYGKGVRNFVVDESFEISLCRQYPAASFLQVKNVLAALQDVAAWHRCRFELPVIGITGSNGKTIVKDWLYQLLQPAYQVVRSPKSYNSQSGVPLSVWQINSQHTLGIFEAGISEPGEMQRLQKIIRPSIGVLTNIGEAHSEGFANIQQKINEKLCLFEHSQTLICNADNPVINEAVTLLLKTKNTSLHLFTWGYNKAASLHILSVTKQEDNSIIAASFQTATGIRTPVTVTIPFTDDASVENAISCCCVLLQLGTPVPVIAERMRQLKKVEMRLELKQGINNCSVINDAYSADINSLTIALDFLSQQQQHPAHTIILSDILQTGRSNESLYAEVAAILQQKKINRLIGIGPEISKAKAAFQQIPLASFFNSVADFKEQFHSLHFSNETILLKGARIFEFEQIVHLLEEKVHQTVLEINLSAISHNLRQYRQLLKPEVKVMVMVKAFSYGSGSFEIANLLQFHKVDYLAVAFADEGVELRKAGISLPIMVMSPEENTFDVMVQYDLEPELYSFAILRAFCNYLEQAGIETYPVHLKFDTGMHRLGFEEKDLAALLQLLNTSGRLKIQSAFSHLVASDNEKHDAFTQQQAAVFARCCNGLAKVVPYSFLQHIANTSAILRHQQLQLDMVRLGIGLYGVDGFEPMQQKLQNVTTLKTTIAQVRHIKAGESVGYNRAAIVTEDSVIATVRIGYADGYSRMLGNGNGKMLVNGQLAPVIGNVCMDMTMLNITGIAAREGDTVIVFGAALPVTEVGKWAGTIAYEILAGISQRVKRVYFEE